MNIRVLDILTVILLGLLAAGAFITKVEVDNELAYLRDSNQTLKSELYMFKVYQKDLTELIIQHEEILDLVLTGKQS